jgi:hypothetical protein
LRDPAPHARQKNEDQKKIRIADLVELAEDLRGGPVAGGGPGAEIKEGARPPAALLPPHLTEYVLQYGVLAAAPDNQGCGSESGPHFVWKRDPDPHKSQKLKALKGSKESRGRSKWRMEA